MPKSKSSKKKIFYVFIVLAVLLILSQAERFIRSGTLFGYRVRTVTSATVTANRNASGDFKSSSLSKTNGKSLACETFTSKEVAGVVKGDVTRISGFMPDKTKPLTVSNCIYKVNDPKNGVSSVSILLRDTENDDAAKKTVEQLRAGKDVVVVKGLGDEAIFNASTNQLTQRKGKRLITITVPKTAASKADSKATAVTIMKLGG